MDSSRSSNVVKTALDDVFYTEYNVEQHPGYITAKSASAFKQDTADSSAVIMELFAGSGAWELTAEKQNLPIGESTVDDNKVFTVTKYSKKEEIPKEFFDDNKHNVYENAIRHMAMRGRTTRDSNAMALYRTASTTTLTADGVALLSASHTTRSGATVDNLMSGALTNTTLNEALVALAEQLGQDGVISGHIAATLLVPVANFNNACTITKSAPLKSGTANNDINYFSEIYPGLEVVTSPYLGAAAGGSDSAWFLLSKNHAVTRWVRTPIYTYLKDYTESDNEVYKYVGGFREVTGVMTYEGIVGYTTT